MSSDWPSVCSSGISFLLKNLKLNRDLVTRKASSIRFSRFALRSDLAFQAPKSLLSFKFFNRNEILEEQIEGQSEVHSGGLGKWRSAQSGCFWLQSFIRSFDFRSWVPFRFSKICLFRRFSVSPDGLGVRVSRIGLFGVLVGVGVGLVGCKEKELVRVAPARTVVVRQTGADFQMPPVLWDKLLPSDAAGITDLKTEEEDGNTTAAVNFAPVNVILTEKNPGVLIHSPIKFEFPQGGGVIDVSDWVTGQPGTFFVDFDIEGNSTPEFLTVYYLSRAKKRRFDNSIFGAGCRSFFNIKKHFLTEHKKYGMAVNTTRNLHSTILGGHFLFSWQKSDAFMVTQVQFVDSKNPQLFCDDDKEKSAE